MDDTVIPPVEAGTIESTVSVDYDVDRLQITDGFTATGEHVWEFDLDAYVRATGLDLGADYPRVPQENGHSLRLVTDYRFSESDYLDETTYTLIIEQRGFRGTTRRDEMFFTRCGYYRLDSAMVVGEGQPDRQPYQERVQINRDVPHFDPYELQAPKVSSGEELVYGLHSGRFGPPVHERLAELIGFDSPAEAVPVEHIDQQSDSETTATSAD